MVDDGYILEDEALGDQHEQLIQSFRCGDQFWEQDVEDFLKADALDWQRRGYCHTTLYFLPGFTGVAAYLAAAPRALLKKQYQEHVKQLPEEEQPLDTWRQVPAMYIAYMGVHGELRGRDLNLGSELHLRILENIRASLFRPRWLFLHVYAESRAVKFWAERGYDLLETKRETPRRDTQERELLTLALDLRGSQGIS